MAATHSSQNNDGFISRHPGWVGAIFAILVAVGFLGALYNSATSHHEGGAPAHGGSAAPAAHH